MCKISEIRRLDIHLWPAEGRLCDWLHLNIRIVPQAVIRSSGRRLTSF
jgi:hypothetical protein